VTRESSAEPAALPLLGAVRLPAMSGPLQALWDVIASIAQIVPSHRWVLVGGQMVTLHALAAGRTPVRVSHDVDVLADLLTARDGLRMCVDAVGALGLAPQEDSSGRLYRFTRALDGVRDGVSVDILAPDHTPPAWPLRTARGKDTIAVDGGRQALQRAGLITVTHGSLLVSVPVPDPLGALVLKAAAWIVDARDRDRHAYDAALLTSLISDPIGERTRFAGSDRRRLNKLDTILHSRDHPAWAALGEHAGDAHTTWLLLNR
jgi:predicted nucleotidyltransferase